MTNETKVETWHKVDAKDRMAPWNWQIRRWVGTLEDSCVADHLLERDADAILADHAKAAALDDARAALERIVNRCNSYAEADKQGLMLSTKQDAEATLARLDNAKEPTQ